MTPLLVLPALLGLGVGEGTVADKGTVAVRSRPVITKPDRSYGTSIQWEQDLEGAARKAVRQGRMLLVLAVAGHFEDPVFT